jgi:hypothetical protein
MQDMQYQLTFWPSYSQFVVYDVGTPYDPDMVPHFNGPGEFGDNPLRMSIRRLEVSVGLLEGIDVHIELTTHAAMPSPPTGLWTLTGTASLDVPSGKLGIRDIINDNDAPELAVMIPPGKVMLRASGRIIDAQQMYTVQIWPA